MTETTSCPLCNSPKISEFIKPYAIPDKIGVIRCYNCKAVFLDKRIDHHDYWDTSPQEEIYLKDEVLHAQEAEFIKRLEKIESISEKGKLLDVGGGLGIFSKIAHERGWDAEVSDTSQAALKHASEKFKLKTHFGYLEKLDFEPESYDAITMWDVIEHLTDPLPVIEKISDILTPGGLLAIKTPNENSFFKWFARNCYRFSFGMVKFPLKYVYYSPHFFSFTANAIEKLLSRYGLQIVEISFDKTEKNFAMEKISEHYGKSSDSSLVKCLLPLAFVFSSLTGAQNKLIVYAKKK